MGGPAQCPRAAWTQERDLTCRDTPTCPCSDLGQSLDDFPRGGATGRAGSWVSVGLASQDSDAKAGLCLCLCPESLVAEAWAATGRCCDGRMSCVESRHLGSQWQTEH